MDAKDVKRIRETLGLTQEQLGAKIGASRNTVINYEKGKVIPDSKEQILLTLYELALTGSEVDTIKLDGRGNFSAKNETTGTVYKGKVTSRANILADSELKNPTNNDSISMPREVFDQLSRLTETVLSQQRTIETLTQKGGAGVAGVAQRTAVG